MNAKLAARIATGFELLAAALLAGAVGFAVHAFGSASTSVHREALTAVSSAAAFIVAIAILRRQGHVQPRVRPFDVRELEFTDADELLLTEEHRPALVEPNAAEEPEPLILDDVLEEVEPDSRVVRLFDRKAMPTPGQLQSRIERHLGHRQSTPEDASQALSEALAELRRSLR